MSNNIARTREELLEDIAEAKAEIENATTARNRALFKNRLRRAEATVAEMDREAEIARMGVEIGALRSAKTNIETVLQKRNEEVVELRDQLQKEKAANGVLYQEKNRLMERVGSLGLKDKALQGAKAERDKHLNRVKELEEALSARQRELTTLREDWADQNRVCRAQTQRADNWKQGFWVLALGVVAIGLAALTYLSTR